MKKLVLSVLLLSLLTGCGETEISDVELSAVIIPAAEESSEQGESESSTEIISESTETPTKDAEKVKNNKLTDILYGMSLHEKVCQMFMTTPESVAGYGYLTFADEWFKACYDEYPVGGFILFTSNISYSDQLIQLNSDLQAMAKEANAGAFISVDEEGGSLTRVNMMLGTQSVYDMSYYGNLNDSNEAFYAGSTIGGYLYDYGFNVDFAPIADVNINPYNELGSRIFSSDATIVSDMSAAVVRGLKSQKICSTLKHFPGLGAGEGNTHYGSVYIERTYEQLQMEEFPAFSGGIEAGADFVMVGHQIVSAAVDKDKKELPADLSPTVVTDWLRGDMGFEGIAITDSHAMGAISNTYTSGEAAVMAVKAGIDIILMPADLRSAADSLEEAVKSGEIPLTRINESVMRILEKKDELGLLEK